MTEQMKTDLEELHHIAEKEPDFYVPNDRKSWTLSVEGEERPTIGVVLYARSFYLSKVDEKLLKKFNSQYGGAFKANNKQGLTLGWSKFESIHEAFDAARIIAGWPNESAENDA